MLEGFAILVLIGLVVIIRQLQSILDQLKANDKAAKNRMDALKVHLQDLAHLQKWTSR